MGTRLAVAVDPAGIPSAEIPLPFMWDLVEYLSCQRVAVSYQYEASHFKVTFTRQDAIGAQKVLDEWQHVREHSLMPA